MAEAWNAKWISFAYDPRQDLGVFAFRRAFTNSSSIIRISADNRYKLYCNGKLVGMGPQRGDERHWFYETYDLTPYLAEGENELVALVWNFGWMAPMAQHTVRTGFVVEDLTPPPSPLPAIQPIRGEGESLSTPGEWEVARVPGWDFDMMHSGVAEFYIDVGPGEIIDARQLPHGSGEDLLLDTAQLSWGKPHIICTAEDRGATGGGTPWMLIPATLPPQRYSQSDAKASELSGAEAPHSWVYDFGELLCAYPRFRLTGPAGTEVRVTYAESMWIPGTDEKGNRNETEGKEVRGYQDRFILSGGEDVFEPLWWRTFRFVELAFHPLSSQGRGSDANLNGSEELGSHPSPPIPLPWDGRGEPRVVNFEAIETGYPYAVESSFEADDPWVKPIWDVSVRTAQRCAGETYFDCPYYEQLQYVGDSRIQALIGYYLGGDRRLQRNCIDQIGWSLMENGLTQSRYPSRQTQVIPPFSLWWVMMLYDQMLYDPVWGTSNQWEQLSRQVAQSETVLEGWQHLLQQPNDAFWCFGDWVPSWKWGVPAGGPLSPVFFIQYAAAKVAHVRLRSIIEVQRIITPGTQIPKDVLATMNSEEVKKLLGPTRQVPRQMLPGVFLVESPDDRQPVVSDEHTLSLQLLSYLLVGAEPPPWPTEALAAANAAKCTYYFSYYKHLAMFGGPTPPPSPLPATQAIRGEGETDYLTLLAPWKEQIENGLTTFAENPEPTRSDCHAWSAHPILGFFQIVAGVTSIAPAWKKAQIMPHPGDLNRFDARIAHPDGDLRVLFEGGHFEIDSPVPFTFKWKNKSEEFLAGRHQIGR